MVNNQDKIAERINGLGYVGVSAVGDDGNVCVSIANGSKEYVWDVAKAIESELSGLVGLRTGDGVQEGTVFINCKEHQIHEELSDVLNMF